MKEKDAIPFFVKELSRILDGNSASKIFSEPSRKMDEKDVFIGVITNPVLINLYHLTKRLSEYIEDYKTGNNIDVSQVFRGMSVGKVKEVANHLQLVLAFAESVRDVKWSLMKAEFPDFSHYKYQGTALCEGWKLVAFSTTGENNPQTVIAEIVMVKKNGLGDEFGDN